MATFPLQVVSMDGLIYEGQVQQIIVRTDQGDVAILARHMNYCTALGMGRARILLEDGTEKEAACIGGMLSVMDGTCRVISTTWEWGENIDLERAKAAKKKAEERLADTTLSKEARVRAEAKLYRALVRISTASKE